MHHSAVLQCYFSWPQWLQQSEPQQLYRQGRGTSFFASLQLSKPRITHGVVPKMKAPLQESFELDVDGAELLIGWKKGCPYCAILC